MADLKLQALDGLDLAVLSALCQDAVVRVEDLAFDRRDRRFVLVCNRFDGMPVADKGRRGYERRRTGLRFERVTRAQIAGFDVRAAGTVLALLAITFAPGDAPAGQITLQFAAGAAVRLDVDCIEAELKDLGAVWSTALKPDHTADDPAAAAAGHGAEGGQRDTL